MRAAFTPGSGAASVDADPVERLERAVRAVVPVPPLASAIAREAALLRLVRPDAAAIVEVRPPERRPARREPHYASFALFGTPTVIIKTNAPVEVRRLLGTQSGVTHLGLAPDDHGGFLACWKRNIT
jgi:hypothetical protein